MAILYGSTGVDYTHTLISCGAKQLHIYNAEHITAVNAKKLWSDMRKGELQGNDTWAITLAAFWLVPKDQIDPVIALVKPKMGYQVFGDMVMVYSKFKVPKTNHYLNKSNALLEDAALKPTDKDNYSDEEETF